MHPGTKNVFKKIFKIFAWIIGSIIFLLVATALLIQVPSVQTWLTGKAVSFLEEKIGTEVSLGGISISFPKSVVLEDIYLEDQNGDTLLYAGKLAVDTDLFALTRNEIHLNEILLENAAAFVSRAETDSSFNYTYILDAFAGDSTAVPDTLEQKGWNISLQTVALERIRLRFEDRLQGNLLNMSLGAFEVEMRTFDLEKNTFEVEEILLENTRAAFKQTKLLSTPEETTDQEDVDSTASTVIGMDELTLRNVQLSYEQVVLGQLMRLDLGEAVVLSDKIDLINQEIALNSVSLKGTSLAMHQREADTVLTTENTREADAASGKPWSVSLTSLDLGENSIQYYDYTKPHLRGTVDFDHLWLTGLTIRAKDLSYRENNIRVDVDNFSFREQSGFTLKTFRGKADITNNKAILENILLETGNSRLQLTATAGYRSLKQLGSEYAAATITSDINNSYINVTDILYFNPSFLDSIPLNLPSDTKLAMDARLRGSLKDLSIEHLEFRTLTETYLRTSGKISGLPETKDLNLNIDLDKFHTTRRDMRNILPDTLMPDSIQFPDWINLEAKYSGSLQNATFNSLLTSDAGSIDAKGNMNLDSTSAMRGANVTLKVNDLDVGGILGKHDSVMGKLVMRAELNTHGLTPEEMTGTLTALVERFDYNGYQYNDLRVNGTIEDQKASLTALMDDQNLEFELDAGYTFSDEVPVYDINFDLKNADFRALNLSTSPLRARGILMVDMATSDFQVLNGNVGIRKVAIFNGDDLYAVDSLLFASIDQEGRSEINIDSDLLKARFEGSINIFGLPQVMREYFHTYYSLHDSLDVKDAQRQHFTFEIELKNTDLLTDLLIPDLTTFDPGPIKGEFDSETQNLELDMEIDAIQYANIGITSLGIKSRSDSRSLRYNLLIDKIMIDSMKIDGLAFNGTVANDSLRTDLILLDSADREKYILAGTFFSLDNGFALKLSPQGNVLNYQKWTAPDDNYMRFGEPKFVAHNVQLQNMREKIMIHSDEAPETPVILAFRELNLEYLSSMIAEENPLSGLLNGDISFNPEEAGMTFTSDLTIKDFRIKQVPWGDIALQVEQTIRDRFDVDFSLTGNGNDIAINGFYSGGTTPSMDVNADFNRFNLASLQPLLQNQFQNLKGIMSGEIRARGTTALPDIDGGLLINDAAFLSRYLNTTFSIDDESISFVDEGLSFAAFEIADENGNKARLDGSIRTRTYRDFQFNLDLFTDNFRLFNTTAADNDLFYGKVDVEANAKIRGDMTTPIINVDIGLSEGSNLTYVVPQSEASILQAEGIVKFVDKSFEGDPFMQQISQEASDTVKSTFRGIDLTARIELSDQETFTIIIDPLTGDQLSVRGNSTLTLSVDPTGDINLSGRYEIAEGTYNLSFYKFVKREFSIESGSSITWLGDPLNAQMDIRAIYNVETSPIELFSNQLTGADPSEVNQYKQTLPFLVYLNITGELLQPEIGFKLEMPMADRNAFGGNVYARLMDINTRESDLNKQVFALLILKRFIADDPFENQGGGGFESTARRSVSKILSEQLNRLSENIKGVELSFDIKSYEDYTSGQAQGQTELQLGVSKSLFNDRLVVKLSGNIDIEGENANRDATDFIGDLALEYKLTPDGRLRITGFRNSNYDMIDGELTETGAGLIYVKDYNTLSELFKANAEKNN